MWYFTVYESSIRDSWIRPTVGYDLHCRRREEIHFNLGRHMPLVPLPSLFPVLGVAVLGNALILSSVDQDQCAVGSR